MPRWDDEARQRQAELIKEWKPWRKSTGPRTVAGKAASAQNSCVMHRIALYRTKLNRLREAVGLAGE